MKSQPCNTFIKRWASTHCVGGECSEHDGGEAFIQRGHALLPDQLTQDVPEAVGILSFRSCGGRSIINIEQRCDLTDKPTRKETPPLTGWCYFTDLDYCDGGQFTKTNKRVGQNKLVSENKPVWKRDLSTSGGIATAQLQTPAIPPANRMLGTLSSLWLPGGGGGTKHQ